MIEIKDLSKFYGDHCALAGLSLSIPEGEICGLLGPNGAGKTTTIRALTGLVRPTTGSVTLGGIDLLREPERAKRLLAYVPDRPYLYEKLTGHEFLAFVGGLYDMTPAECARAAAPYLDLMGLQEHAARMIEGYSHGMKQKLMITSALLHHPRIFIVDEPMVGLDPASARRVCALFRELSGQGITVLLSTHTLSVAEKICDRIAILNRGKLVALGRLAELKSEAHVAGGTLEEVFLKLTEEEQEEAAKLQVPQ